MLADSIGQVHIERGILGACTGEFKLLGGTLVDCMGQGHLVSKV